MVIFGSIPDATINGQHLRGVKMQYLPDLNTDMSSACENLQVSLPLVRQFVSKVEESALGVKVVKGVRPDQQLVKVVNDELVNLMGGEKQDLNEPRLGPQVHRAHPWRFGGDSWTCCPVAVDAGFLCAVMPYLQLACGAQTRFPMPGGSCT